MDCNSFFYENGKDCNSFMTMVWIVTVLMRIVWIVTVLMRTVWIVTVLCERYRF